MTKEQILHLGNLARIKLSEEEVEQFNSEITAVLEYVSTVNDIAGDAALTKQVGARYNIFRQDEVTNEPGQFTEDLLREMPETDGRHLKVKKILNQDD
ncbi:MAG: Asp-tRNA(Asn)/Glu-tRNA(Gln) amidotransferase subunit GatC [Patescibacteria group bacterium]